MATEIWSIKRISIRTIGELLTEEVRFFLGDLLRTSASTYVYPQYPHSFPRYEFHHFKVKEDSLVIQRVVQYHLLSQHLVPHIQLEYGVLLGLGQL